jgi:hypothetical protein
VFACPCFFAPRFSNLAFGFQPFDCISLLPTPNSDYILSLLHKDRGWLMEAVRIEKVAGRYAEGAFLTGCAGIGNRAVPSSKEGLIEAGADQSRDKSWSARARMPQPHVQPSSESSHFCGKLNRQTPEVETTLNLRKQRTANCSNRQKIKFCEARNSSLISARNSPISNRELLELEIPQHAENKPRGPVLIANFEPNPCSNFRAYVAAAFLPRGTRGRSAQFPRQSLEQAGPS